MAVVTKKDIEEFAQEQVYKQQQIMSEMSKDVLRKWNAAVKDTQLALIKDLKSAQDRLRDEDTRSAMLTAEQQEKVKVAKEVESDLSQDIASLTKEIEELRRDVATANIFNRKKRETALSEAEKQRDTNQLKLEETRQFLKRQGLDVVVHTREYEEVSDQIHNILNKLKHLENIELNERGEISSQDRGLFPELAAIADEYKQVIQSPAYKQANSLEMDFYQLLMYVQDKEHTKLNFILEDGVELPRVDSYRKGEESCSFDHNPTTSVCFDKNGELDWTIGKNRSALLGGGAYLGRYLIGVFPESLKTILPQVFMDDFKSKQILQGFSDGIRPDVYDRFVDKSKYPSFEEWKSAMEVVKEQKLQEVKEYQRQIDIDKMKNGGQPGDE